MAELIYLDNSATSFPKPESVYDFMNCFYRTKGVAPVVRDLMLRLKPKR